MKITVLTGSPHKKGTTALLADQLIAGAMEAGHQVTRFDAAFENVKPCLACDYCASHDGECVHRDAMNDLSRQLVETELIVLVTPLYYFTMSAQLKTVVDRFHASNAKLAGNKKAMLLAASYGADDWTMKGLEKTYESMLRFLNWEDAGKLLAIGCPAREVLEQTDFPQQAYKMGQQIK